MLFMVVWISTYAELRPSRYQVQQVNWVLSGFPGEKPETSGCPDAFSSIHFSYLQQYQNRTINIWYLSHSTLSFSMAWSSQLPPELLISLSRSPFHEEYQSNISPEDSVIYSPPLGALEQSSLVPLTSPFHPPNFSNKISPLWVIHSAAVDVLQASRASVFWSFIKDRSVQTAKLVQGTAPWSSKRAAE